MRFWVWAADGIDGGGMARWLVGNFREMAVRWACVACLRIVIFGQGGVFVFLFI